MEQRLIVLECAGCTAPMSEAIMTNGIHKCPYCGYINILPKEEQSSEVLHHLRNADIELRDYEFERAYNAYAKASELDSEESKAYFGMALASNRVKYIKDVVGNRWQAICCEVTDKKFSEDTNYLHALEHATEEQRAEYEARAKEIDYIREKFVELQNSGLSYDTFICVKVSDENGGFTQDSMWANKLYDSITKSGAKAFYSEKEIGDRVGSDYEALILYALYTSKSMIVVCSNDDYLRTPWVQNEYTRYYSMLNAEEKAKNSIMIAFSEQVIERIPGIPGRIQGVDLHKFDTSQKVNEFVNKFANATERARKKAEEKAKAEAERKAKEEAQQKMLEELQRKLIEVEERTRFKSNENVTNFSEENEDNTEDNTKENKINERLFEKNREEELKSREENSVDSLEDTEFDNENDTEIDNSRTSSIRKSTEKFIEWVSKDKKRASLLFSAFLLVYVIIVGVLIITDAMYSFEYEKVDGGYSISKVVNAEEVEIIEIPSTYNELPVVAIGARAFESCSNLTSLTIPDGITSIGNYAFSYCTSLASVTIPNSVTSIGESAFFGCTSLTSVTIPNSVTSIGESAFYNCTSLTSIIIPDSITSIENSAFCNCTSLESVTIPDSVTSIGNCAFSYCTSLTSVTIGKGVTSIESYAFHYCTSLTSITIPDSVTSIGAEVFYGCTGLTSIIIPNSVTSIENWAFYGCASLKNIYCKAKNRPSGWNIAWSNYCNAKVVWGYNGE